MSSKILAANRGEIALRIMRSASELGARTVAVYSHADAHSTHMIQADESYCIGPPPAVDSYLNIPALITACEITGADAVHPGYGFLSESPGGFFVVELIVLCCYFLRIANIVLVFTRQNLLRPVPMQVSPLSALQLTT